MGACDCLLWKKGVAGRVTRRDDGAGRDRVWRHHTWRIKGCATHCAPSLTFCWWGAALALFHRGVEGHGRPKAVCIWRLGSQMNQQTEQWPGLEKARVCQKIVSPDNDKENVLRARSADGPNPLCRGWVPPPQAPLRSQPESLTNNFRPQAWKLATNSPKIGEQTLHSG